MIAIAKEQGMEWQQQQREASMVCSPDKRTIEQLTNKAEHGCTDPPNAIAKVQQTSGERREGNGKVEP
jgi:hypothetical protein